MEGALGAGAPCVDVTESASAAVPMYLVRHAKAGNRLRWTEPDHIRPLTKGGLKQADALVELFADQPFSRLLSSPYVRCVQTFEPLAESRGLPLETASELGEGAPFGEALELMLSAATDGPAALSVHGDLMMHAVEHALATGVRHQGPVEFKKGATWILDVRAGAFEGARYLPPPVA